VGRPSLFGSKEADDIKQSESAYLESEGIVNDMLQTQPKTFGLSKVPTKKAPPASMINNDFTPLSIN